MVPISFTKASHNGQKVEFPTFLIYSECDTLIASFFGRIFKVELPSHNLIPSQTANGSFEKKFQY